MRVAKNATGNDLYVNSAANIFAASMYPNISIPIALGDVDENNRINVTGDSRLRAVQDVALEALTGIAAGDRVLREGAVVSLSAIPYGFDAIQNGDDDTTNRVSIGSDTEVTGGAFNELSYKVFAINNPDNMGSGTNANIPLPAGVDLSSGPVTLTAQQKVTFGVDGHELDYEFAEVGVEGISLDASQGSTVIKLVKEDGTTSGTSPNAFAGGELGASYLLRNVTGQTVQLQPHLVDFSDTSVWRSPPVTPMT